MLSPEKAVHLAQTVLSNANSAQADALCELIKGVAGTQPPPSASVEDRKRYDAAYAVLMAMFPLTTHCQDAFARFLDLAA